MGRAENGAVPVGHEQVVTVLQAVGAGLGTEALLALLQLFQQAEVARHFGAHGVRRGTTRACGAVASGASAGSVGSGEICAVGRSRVGQGWWTGGDGAVGRASNSPPGAGGQLRVQGRLAWRDSDFTCRSTTEATQAHLTTSQCRQSAKRGHDRPDPVRRAGQSRQRVQKEKPRPAQCPFAPCSLDLPASPADSSFSAQAADKSLQELRSLPSTSEAQLAAGWSCPLRVSAPA